MLSEHGMLFMLSMMHSYFESMTVSWSWFNNHISEGQLVCSLYTLPKIFLYHHKSFLSDLVALLSLSLFLPTPTLHSPILLLPHSPSSAASTKQLLWLSWFLFFRSSNNWKRFGCWFTVPVFFLLSSAYGSFLSSSTSAVSCWLLAWH